MRPLVREVRVPDWLVIAAGLVLLGSFAYGLDPPGRVETLRSTLFCVLVGPPIWNGMAVPLLRRFVR
jgi:hypothetical protein